MDTLDVAKRAGDRFNCPHCGKEHVIQSQCFMAYENDDGSVEGVPVNRISIHCGCGRESVLYERDGEN